MVEKFCKGLSRQLATNSAIQLRFSGKFPCAGRLAFFAAAAAAFGFIWVFQFSTPVILDMDGYYHLAVAGFIKKYGFLHAFHWTQMSVMKLFYADKDLLFHVLIVPFTWFGGILAAKCAAIFFGAVFLAALSYALWRLAGPGIAAALLALAFTSPIFTVYLLYLRPATLAGALTVLGLYFLINKKHYAVGIVTALYTLSHLSAFTMIFFALLCEALRRLVKKEFHQNNVSYAVAGMLVGLMIHPNFPANLFTIYLNGFLTPWRAIVGGNISFAQELYTMPAKDVFLDNFTVFAIFGAMLWVSLCKRLEISFATIFLTASAQVYFVLAMMSTRFWYPALPLALMALASYLRDLRQTDGAGRVYKTLFIAWLAVVVSLVPRGANHLRDSLQFKTGFTQTYEDAALWMRANIPAGETVYHSLWGDSPYFIYFNPKNDYLNVLDPIYMYAWSPNVEALYEALGKGTPDLDAYFYLKKTFRVKYGFTLKAAGFYHLIKDDKRIKMLYDNGPAVVFMLTDEPPPGKSKKSPAHS